MPCGWIACRPRVKRASGAPAATSRLAISPINRAGSAINRPSRTSQSITGWRHQSSCAGVASATHHRLHLLRRGPVDLVGREVGDLVDVVGHVLDGRRTAADAHARRLAILDAREGAGAGAPDLAGALALLAAEVGDH